MSSAILCLLGSLLYAMAAENCFSTYQTILMLIWPSKSKLLQPISASTSPTMLKFIPTILRIIRHIIKASAVETLHQIMGKLRKRQTQNASRRKISLINKTYEYGKLYGADVALIIYQNGRYTTYRSVNKPCFPPSMEEIVSLPIMLLGLC